MQNPETIEPTLEDLNKTLKIWIDRLNSSDKKSRSKSLVVTKLEEAKLWLTQVQE